MTPSEQRRAFERARRAAAQRRTAIVADTRTEILRQLTEAEQQITLLLAQQPDDTSRWRLQNLQREVRRAMDEFSGDSRPLIQRGLSGAWRAGEQLVDAPLAAAQVAITGVQNINTRALEAMRAIREVNPGALHVVTQERASEPQALADYLRREIVDLALHRLEEQLHEERHLVGGPAPVLAREREDRDRVLLPRALDPLALGMPRRSHR